MDIRTLADKLHSLAECNNSNMQISNLVVDNTDNIVINGKIITFGKPMDEAAVIGDVIDYLEERMSTNEAQSFIYSDMFPALNAKNYAIMCLRELQAERRAQNAK